jgi:cell division septation protein DedD
MAATHLSERRARYAEALLFWTITLVVCAAAGYGSYRYGRNWIGDRLGTDVKSVLTSDQLASKVTSEAFDRPGVEQESDAAEEPPKEAAVEVTAVPLDAADKSELDAEAAGKTTPAKEPDEADTSADDTTNTPSADRDKPASPDEGKPADTEPKAQRVASSPAPPASSASPAAPTSAASTDEGGDGRYVVRAGSFAKRDNAERTVQELRAKGYSPYLTSVVKDGVEYTRVNVGSYQKRAEALKLRGELRGDGYTDASIAGE